MFPYEILRLWLNITGSSHSLPAPGREPFLSWQLHFFFNSPSFEKQAKAIFASGLYIPLMSEMTSVLTQEIFLHMTQSLVKRICKNILFI